MVHDRLRQFEDQDYPRLLLEAEHLAQPQPSQTPPPLPSAPPAPGKDYRPAPPQGRPQVAEIKLIPARAIKVHYAKPWVASEADLDDYLEQLRQAWLQEIQAGNRVQI